MVCLPSKCQDFVPLATKPVARHGTSCLGSRGFRRSNHHGFCQRLKATPVAAARSWAESGRTGRSAWPSYQPTEDRALEPRPRRRFQAALAELTDGPYP